MKQLTAIEWYVKELQTRLLNFEEVNYVELAEEAKVYEKQQCINFAEKWESGVPHDSKEDLYDEIYKNNND